MVRYTELDAARRGAEKKLDQAREASRSSQITAIFVGVDPDDDQRVLIRLDEQADYISIIGAPIKLIPGSLVSVSVDAAGRPQRLIGPASVRPPGLDDDADLPAAEIPMRALAPRELTAEEAQAIQDTADNLEQARKDLEDATAEAEDNFRELDEKLGAAFPTGPFDVKHEINQTKSATLTAAALEAHGIADAAADAAQAAAKSYADGEISEAELRAAQDAAAKAEAARDAAFALAQEDATAKAEGAREAAEIAAAADATAKANAAREAAEGAAFDYANGQISEAELRAATDAATKANAAKDAAIAAAETYAANAAGAAEQAALRGAKTYADTKKAEALTEAATAAQSVAEAAAAAAQEAAEAHADLVAQGANEAAIAAAAQAAQAMADAAEAAAKDHADAKSAAAESAAKTHATNEAARVKQEALTEAATDAKAKADSARDAAIAAAEAYAEAEASGAGAEALRLAKLHADAAAAAAESAAKTAAETYADAAKSAAVNAAALTAQTKADVAKQAAIDAAAADATAKADAAKTAAATDAKTKADAAQAEALRLAKLDATAKADAAKDAAETAAKAHADLVASGASADAIAAAAADAKTKADAAKDAAITAAAADAKAKADAAKDAAITAAATDATAKANAAKTAAENAAKAHADLVASGASADAIAAAAIHAQAMRDEAIAAGAHDLANLEIGGRNYMLNSAQPGGSFVIRSNNSAEGPVQQGTDEIGQWITGTSTYSGLFYLSTYTNPTFAVGRGDVFSEAFYPVPNVYSQSVEVMSEVAIPVRLGGAGTDTLIQPNEWTKISGTFSNGTRMIGITVAANPDVPVGTKLYHRNWKLEKGNKATDWTPAPEDVDASIADAQADASTAVQRANEAVKDTKIEYAVNTSQTNPPTTGWSTATPTRTPGSYIWMRTTVTYGDDTNTVLAPALLTGNDGASGTKLTGTARHYAQTTSGTTVPTSGWVASPPAAIAGRYMWTRTTFSFSDVADQYSYSVSKNGADGGKGDTGISVTSVTPFYRLLGSSVAKPAKPSTMTPSGWTETEPNFTPNTRLWHVERVVYSNNAFTYSEVSESSSYMAAAQAMNTADGKNTTTYTTVASTPGPAPSTSSGANRRQFDMHRNRLSDGTVVGEWMWSGTGWEPVHMGDGIMRSLDVGKLTAGQADIETAVVSRFWAALAVVERLRVEQSAFIDGVNIKDGAVTSRTLNVVPDVLSGGVEILPPGIRIIPPYDPTAEGDAAGTAVSLRTDEEAWFSFAKGGENTYSVNEDGDITGRSLDVRDTVKLQGIPIEEKLDERTSGFYGRAEMSGNSVHMGTEAGRVVMVSIRTPPENRLMKVTVSLRPNVNADRHAEVAIRQSEGEDVKVTNSQKKVWPVSLPRATGWEASQVFTVDEWGWPYDKTITLGVFVKSITANQTIQFSSNHGQTITVEDAGPPIDLQTNNAWVPSSGGGSGGSGGESDKEKRYHEKKFYPSSWQSYRGNNTKYDWNTNMLFHGYSVSSNGMLRSMALFNRTAVNDLVGGTGTEMNRGHIKIFNSHTYSSAGMTVRVGYVSSTSIPNTWNGTTGWTWIGNFTVSRGGVLTIPLNSTHLARIKAGTFRGIGLVSNSTSMTTTSANQYGYFNASKTELFLRVRK